MIDQKTYSSEQEQIVKEFITTDNDLIIQAGPGTGKSFILLELLKKVSLRKKSILVAFNKSIKEELESKTPNHVKVSTLHSLAYSILRNNQPNNYKLNEFKTYIFCKKHIKVENKKIKKEVYWFQIVRIINLCRMNLQTSEVGINYICDQYNITVDDKLVRDVLTVFKELNKYNNKSHHEEFMIDFTDMLWLCHTKVKSEDYTKYDIVFCDELQDVNPLQREIIENSLKKSGRFVGVGDEKQSIYGFMGANLLSLNHFKNRPNTTILTLSTTYRCSKKVVDEANKTFPGLIAYENNIEGSVIYRGNLNDISDGDFVLCRNNLPLVECFIDILKQGKKAIILGKDFGDELLVVLNKTEQYISFKEAREGILLEKSTQLRNKGIDHPENTSQYYSLVEKLQIIEILISEFKSIERTRSKISEIFTDKTTNGIILSTIHKSKGLESKRVYFKSPDLLPSKYAVTEQELYGERCLFYVAVTRSKEDLIYIK